MDDRHIHNAFLPVTSVRNGEGEFLRKDLYGFTNQIVNICFIGDPKEEKWFLVDAGMPNSAEKIVEAVEHIYGENAVPEAIILTHGHFDHIGGLVPLIEKWGVPVYAHVMELPFLTGKENYPEPDPSVEGGMVAKMSRIFPNEGIDLGNHVKPLPMDGTIPGLPDWRWLHTPGHSPGHISLYRESDGSLIAGDAFVTVKQENLYKVLTQEKEISGPPRYLTTDWQSAKKSVLLLESLRPSVAITGHGVPMEGEELTSGLSYLASNFDTIAKPDYGKYVDGEDTL